MRDHSRLRWPAIAEELTSDTSAIGSPAIDLEVEGTTRNLNPFVRDEACRIAGEALRDAFRHSLARRISVELRYEKRNLSLRVRDDWRFGAVSIPTPRSSFVSPALSLTTCPLASCSHSFENGRSNRSKAL